MMSVQGPFSNTSTGGVGSGAARTSFDIQGLLATLNGFDAANSFQICCGSDGMGVVEGSGDVRSSRSTWPATSLATLNQHPHQLQQQTASITSSNSAVLTASNDDVNAASDCGSGDETMAATASVLSCSPPTGKKSANMTERVAVPSSEHVAEIVGRQGCKIKALRNKTNTYIKTPVRGDEPVFVVTGRREDVDAARREIISAAEHFTHIRATRSGGSSSSQHSAAPVVGREAPEHDRSEAARGGTGLSTSLPTSNVNGRRRTLSPSTTENRHRPNQHHHHRDDQSVAATVAGQVTIGVRVPVSMVGLVVGPKGATVKRIQQDTGTYIVTPGRQKDPVFEVIGSSVGVDRARRQIEAYLETRIGPSSSSPFSGTSYASASVQVTPTSTSSFSDCIDWFSHVPDASSTATVDLSQSTMKWDVGFNSDAPLTRKQQQQQQRRLIDHSEQLPPLYSADVDMCNQFNQLYVSRRVDERKTATGDQISPQTKIFSPRHELAMADNDELMSWFCNTLPVNNSTTTTAGFKQQYQHYDQFNRWSSHQQQSNETIWSSDCQHPTAVNNFLVENGADDYDVEKELNSNTLHNWNYIFAAAGLLQPEVDNRYQVQCDNDDVSTQQSSTDGTSNAFWSPIIDLDRCTITSPHAPLKTSLFAGTRPTQDMAATQNIHIGGVTDSKFTSRSSSDGNGRVGDRSHGSEETSPLSISPVDSFSAGSSSG